MADATKLCWFEPSADRLLRHGPFDWRRAMHGMHSPDAHPPFDGLMNCIGWCAYCEGSFLTDCRDAREWLTWHREHQCGALAGNCGG